MQETAEEKEVHLEKAKAKRMEETPQEKEVHLEEAKARRMEETPQEKEGCLERAKTNRKLRFNRKFVNQKDSLKMSNNFLSLPLSINQLNS